MKKVIVLFIGLLSACGKGNALDQTKCADAFSVWSSKTSTLHVGTSTETDVVNLLGQPLSQNIYTASDGSVWYVYDVAEDGSLNQVAPFCGNVDLQFVNNVLQKVTNEQAYK